MKSAKNKPKPEKKKRGRPSVYDAAYHPEQGFKFAVLGLNDEEMAEAFRIDPSTFQKWKLDYPDFSESIARGKLPATSEVADALRKRALGFEWFEEVPTKIKRVKLNDQGKKIEEYEEVVITKVRRVAPPDTQAASLYLRNRLASKWRDKIEVEDAGKFSIAEEIRLARAILEKGGAAHGEAAKA